MHQKLVLLLHCRPFVGDWFPIWQTNVDAVAVIQSRHYTNAFTRDLAASDGRHLLIAFICRRWKKSELTVPLMRTDSNSSSSILTPSSLTFGDGVIYVSEMEMGL